MLADNEKAATRKNCDMARFAAKKIKHSKVGFYQPNVVEKDRQRNYEAQEYWIRWDYYNQQLGK